jgi:hypothetical protein
LENRLPRKSLAAQNLDSSWLVAVAVVLHRGQQPVRLRQQGRLLLQALLLHRPLPLLRRLLLRRLRRRLRRRLHCLLAWFR